MSMRLVVLPSTRAARGSTTGKRGTRRVLGFRFRFRFRFRSAAETTAPDAVATTAADDAATTAADAEATTVSGAAATAPDEISIGCIDQQPFSSETRSTSEPFVARLWSLPVKARPVLEWANWMSSAIRHGSLARMVPSAVARLESLK